MSEKENIREIILIGRGSECNFVVDDNSASRQHAQIIDYGTSYSVVDLGSTNGTFVNGRRVSSETTLHSGDELRVGNAIVPWQQIVQPLQKSKKGKVLLWILIPVLALLLIGGGLAFYFFYWKTKDINEGIKQEKEEVVQDLAGQIEENQQMEAKNADLARYNDSLEKVNSRLKKDNAEAEASRKEAEADRTKAKEDKKKANQDREDAEQAKQEAEKARQDAESLHQEAEKARQEAEKARQEAEKAKQEAEKAKQEAEKAKQEGEILKAIKDLNDGDAKDICKFFNISFGSGYRQKEAREALKEEYLTTTNSKRKELIAEKVKEKQKK